MMFDASKLDSTQSVHASVLKHHYRSQSQLTNDGGIYIREDFEVDNSDAKLDVSDLQMRNLFTESDEQAAPQ